MTIEEAEVLIKHLHQKTTELQKDCNTFLQTSQSMLKVCRDLEHRLSIIEESNDR